MKTLNDYKEEYYNLPEKKNLKGKEALEAVKRDGLALRYVKEQTEDICLEAVKRNVYALQYVKEQTEEICLAALKWGVHALQYVNEDLFKNEEIIELMVLDIERYKLMKNKLKEILKNPKGKTISDENWERWKRQLRTSYNLLSEEEKQSDRDIFDKFYADFIHQIRQDDLNAIKEMIENQISIHSQLEKEWTGIDLIKKIHDKINPHTERKEELEILLNLLTKE